MLVIPYHVQAQLSELANILGESCGVLIGHVDDNRLIVTSISYWDTFEEAKNFCLPISFFSDAIDQHRKKGGQDFLIGIFHTHPDGETALSEIDLAYVKLYNWTWLIATSESEKTLFAAYSCIDQKVSHLPIKLESSLLFCAR